MIPTENDVDVHRFVERGVEEKGRRRGGRGEEEGRRFLK